LFFELRPDPKTGLISLAKLAIQNLLCLALLAPALVVEYLPATFVVGSASAFYHFCS